ncbi:MAG: hypothetical protein HY360_12045, partial [Verrucomicrobia bacterium]|nr:hypothetical protein [Verrucomicrobiota bacterium]
PAQGEATLGRVGKGDHGQDHPAQGEATLGRVGKGDPIWPPALSGAVNGTVTITAPDFLRIPESVQKALEQPGAAQFVMAKEPPTVDLACHGNLPDRALNGTGWSAWGDICVAGDGKVYSGIGDHGDDVGGKGRTFIYCWDPSSKTLRQIIDPNQVAGVQSGDPSFTKVHARILEGKDGKIYFTCTHNDGGRAGDVKWTPRIPGGLIFQYDPQTGKTAIIGNLEGALTATTLLDRERNLWYCCLEGKAKAGAGLAAYDLSKPGFIYVSPFDAIVADRNIALDKDGAVYFNGKGGHLWKYDPQSKQIASTGGGFPKQKEGEKEIQPTMRSSTVESKEGWIYGATMGPGRLFRYHPVRNKIELLGPDFLLGDYTTVTVLSPDERYVYYLPGSHGNAFRIGTPVVQYEIASGKRKVLAFLKPVIEKACGYVPAGTYGVKLNADGSILYVNFNGHARKDIRPEKMAESGFGLTAFAAIHIPASER